ncbi:MAG: sensor histidine kinase [Clostridia bacterium]
MLFAAVFAVSFALYRLPAAAVWYAAAICIFIGSIFLFFDYLSFYKKHKALRKLLREITVTAAHMPEPRSLLEADYQALIRTLHADKTALEDEMRAMYTNLVEYYTIWAHQVKTPIAAMRLLLQSENNALNRELSEELQRIEQYVEMVMCYLRLDADSTDYLIKEYDLDDIIRQAVRKYAGQFIRKKIKLDYTPVACKILTDEKWFLFVVEQVLSNALKYTKSGTISVMMDASETLCIKDTGMGIAPEDLPRIFEKGYTGYNGRSDKKASGIGLYLCRRICRNLGHRISAESAVGQGTAIRIDFRRAKLDVE